MEQMIFPTWAETLLLLPMTILFIFACLPLTIKVLNKNNEPHNATTLLISILGVLVATAATIVQARSSAPVFSGALIFDKMAVLSNFIVLGITLFTLFLSYSNVNTTGVSFAEHCFLILLSAVGMLILTSAADLMVAFIGLETMSLALYVLIGLGHEQVFSKEAAFKYFIMGSFASAFFLYGIAFIFGVAGTTLIAPLVQQGAAALSGNALGVMGAILLLVGIGFKVSLFPFHAWTPDVYQGAPTSVSGFMATGVKLVMFTLFLRLAMTPLFGGNTSFMMALQAIAVLTMTVGNITALVQENIKRLVAYSSIAHAGYILIGIIVTSQSHSSDAGAATLFYLLVYSIMNIGAFAVISIFEKEEGENLSVTDYSGLGFRYPALGIALSVFMLSLAGVPPTAGFIGKFYIFAAAIKEGYVPLAIIGVINSLISAYYYLRILVHLYMKEPVHTVSANPGWSPRFVVLATVALTLILGVVSMPFYRPALRSVLSLFTT